MKGSGEKKIIFILTVKLQNQFISFRRILALEQKKNEKILQFEMQFFHSTKIIFDRIFLEQNADGKEFIMSKYCSTNIRKNVSNSQKFRVGLKKSENFRMQIKFVYHFLFGIDFRGKFIPVTFVVSRNSFN